MTAIALAVIFVAIGYTIYMPAVLVGGMVMDSCSGQVIGWLWIAWLWVLWGLVLLASALVPSILILKHRRWRWVFASMVVGTIVSVMWYILWFVVVIGAYNLFGNFIC